MHFTHLMRLKHVQHDRPHHLPSLIITSRGWRYFTLRYNLKMGAFETSGILEHTTSVAGYQNIIDNYIHLRINSVLISTY